MADFISGGATGGRPGGFFHDVWKSASDFRFYRSVAGLPFGSAFMHLVKIAIGMGTVLSVLLVIEMLTVNPLLVWFRDNIPPIRIRNGVASTDVEQPFVAERRRNGRIAFAVIIDTTGKTPRVPDKYANALLLQKKGLTLKVGDKSFHQEFSAIEEAVIDREYFDRLILTPGRLLLYIAAAYGGTLALLFAQSACVAAVGTAVSIVSGAGYSFGAVMRMSFYALSLAVCFLVLALMLGLRMRPAYLFGIYLFIHVAFLSGGVLVGGENVSSSS